MGVKGKGRTRSGSSSGRKGGSGVVGSGVERLDSMTNMLCSAQQDVVSAPKAPRAGGQRARWTCGQLPNVRAQCPKNKGKK